MAGSRQEYSSVSFKVRWRYAQYVSFLHGALLALGLRPAFVIRGKQHIPGGPSPATRT